MEKARRVESTVGVEMQQVTSLRDRFDRRVRDVQHALRYAATPNPHFLVVLGMHRSGTSLVAGLLRQMGAHIGPVEAEQKVLESDEVHWEGSSLTWINDEMLRAAGGRWDAPPPSVAGSVLDILRARRFLWEFAGATIAGVKDPRMCLTYPVWRRVLPTHSIICCVRHPMNVARSLAAREGWPVARGLDLWLEYNRCLSVHIDSGRTVYWFNFDDGGEAIRKLVLSLSRDHRQLRADDRLREQYQAEIHHHRTNAGSLPLEVESLYDHLRERAV